VSSFTHYSIIFELSLMFACSAVIDDIDDVIDEGKALVEREFTCIKVGYLAPS
jgi:hypothetical protein